MRKLLVLVVAFVSISLVFSGVALADEWYHGNDGTQPGIGINECPAAGPGMCDGTGGDVDNGLRLRFKDY